MSAYIDHISQVNDIQPVLARTDILSVDGEVIALQGIRIDTSVAKKLGQFKLAKPIESSLILEEGFNAELIYQLFHEFITSDPYFEELLSQRDLDDKIIQCIESFCALSALGQRLNVLAIQMPDVFDQSLFCAWMSVSVLTHENYSQKQLNNTFIAALCHDVGLLDISPAILFKETALSSEEWQILQQHPQLSYDFLYRFKEIDSESMRAVLEHHESFDGTGYPNGKFEKQLGEFGRLLHILDSANAIYRKHLKPRHRSLNDMVPILQMSTLSRGGHFVESLTTLFNRTSKTKHTSLHSNLVSESIQMVKANANEISAFINITDAFTKDIGSKHQDIKVLTVQNIARLIKTTLTSCGIINEAYMRWLDQVEQEQLEFAYREIEDVLLMTEEIKFHILRCERQIAVYISQQTGSPLHMKMSQLQLEITSIEKYHAGEELRLFLEGKNVA